MDGVPEIVGGIEDHVHILASLRPVHCIADVLRDLKKESSTWAKENFNRRFTWQEGYAAFTVSPTATDTQCGGTLPLRRRIIVNIPLLMN